MPPARRENPPVLSHRTIAVALLAALLVAASLITASVLGSRGDSAVADASPPVASKVERRSLFRGIPQRGIALGSAAASVTVVEFADLQCPYCAQWARDTLPAIVDDYVRPGRVRILFRGLAFIGPDSETALRASLAAGEQGRLWDVVHDLYESQGAENSGWVTESLLSSVGGAGFDTERMLESTHSARVEREIAAAERAAAAAAVPGTPFFLGGSTGGRLAPLSIDPMDTAEFRRALDRLLTG